MDKRTTQLYRVYLLRCWQEEGVSPEEEPVWHFCVQEIWHEGQRPSATSPRAPGGTSPNRHPTVAIFIVRMWAELTEGGDLEWRGQVVHVRSG